MVFICRRLVSSVPLPSCPPVICTRRSRVSRNSSTLVLYLCTAVGCHLRFSDPASFRNSSLRQCSSRTLSSNHLSRISSGPVVFHSSLRKFQLQLLLDASSATRCIQKSTPKSSRRCCGCTSSSPSSWLCAFCTCAQTNSLRLTIVGWPIYLYDTAFPSSFHSIQPRLVVESRTFFA